MAWVVSLASPDVWYVSRPAPRRRIRQAESHAPASMTLLVISREHSSSMGEIGIGWHAQGLEWRSLVWSIEAEEFMTSGARFNRPPRLTGQGSCLVMAP